jgi:hypothetical protein
MAVRAFSVLPRHVPRALPTGMQRASQLPSCRAFSTDVQDDAAEVRLRELGEHSSPSDSITLPNNP